MFVKNFLSFLFLITLLITSINPVFGQESKTLFPLIIKNKKLFVEIARTEKEKARGLMFREKLAENEGMLFIYEREEILSFWMKNTFLPLSIAFLDREGRIIDIQDMEPFSEKTHYSPKPAQYALEVNKGWFRKNGIRVGDFVKIPPFIFE